MYSVDPLRPDRLRCEECGHSFPVTPRDTDPACLLHLCADEAAGHWPELADEIHRHSVACLIAWLGRSAARLGRSAAARAEPPGSRAPRNQFSKTDRGHPARSAVRVPGYSRRGD
jgi:hypothetical protein